ncbi:Protein-glutamate methylesterase/protein-glutamine glutaminase [subsurface metagenome]
MTIAQKKLLGESLVEKGLITEEQLRQAELEAKADAKPLRKILTEKGLISEQTVLVQGAASDEMTVKAKKDTKRILVVDDVESIVMSVKKFLERHRYEVITANDGQEGLEKAKTEKPDLIVLDLMLPKMNGYKVCGLLKKDTRYAKIPVVMFTAKAQEKDVKLGQEVGADAYITKPYESEVLLAKIKELLKE